MRNRTQQVRDLDRIDRNILRLLQADGRMSMTELADRVGLSVTPCSERVRRLERDGFILGYHARLNPGRLGADLLVFVEIRLVRTSKDVFQAFKAAVVELPQVLECHLVSGDFDYLIKARVADMGAYRRLLGETLLTLPHVSGSRSYAVMEEVKETLALAVPE